MARKRTKKGRKRRELTDHEIDQRNHIRDIRNLLKNIGFRRIPRVDGVEFKYNGRTGEIDDIFALENIIIVCEYTNIKNPSDHLKGKKIIFDKITEAPKEFFRHIIENMVFPKLNEFYDENIKGSFTLNQIVLKVIYASKVAPSIELKQLLSDIKFLDFPVLKYFESISRIIKKTTRYEFLDFLGIEYSQFGDNVKHGQLPKSDIYHGHILPEEHSYFKDGYKLISFYIDADSLMRRAFVLRRDGWRNKANISLYQRMFVAKKIKSMRKYLHEEKRVFINNLIATLRIDAIKLFDTNEEEIKIDAKGDFKNSRETKVHPTRVQIADKSNTIGIIDGQHRLFSYHEGEDIYEMTISTLRGIQNLLVTAILFPKNENEEKRIKFEANLFLEINSNQSGAPSGLKQEIEYMRNPFSTTSISKFIINKLNESGPLEDMFEEFWYQKGKLKTTSIISFGLRQLVKFEGDDSLFKIWRGRNKNQLKAGVEDFDLLDKYREFCLNKIRDLFIGLKANVPSEQWLVDRKNPNAVLSVTTINGLINCLRLLIQEDKLGEIEYYKLKFKKISGFRFRNFKSSQYRKMGTDIYNKCFT